MTTPHNPAADLNRRCLKLDTWPDGDHLAWLAAIQAGDALEPGGAAAHWVSSTRQGVMQSYGRWLTWLTYKQPSLLRLPLVDRIIPDPIGAYISDLRRINSSSTVRTRIAGLFHAIRVMDPGADLSWLQRVVVRLNRVVQPVINKRNRLVEAGDLFALGMAIMAEAKVAGVPDWHHAQHYRDGLMIALLAARPLRVRNFTAIEVDRHLLRNGTGYQLRFEASEVKMRRRPLEFPVPTDLVACLERYIAIYRPILCLRSSGAPVSSRLWVSTMGTPLQERAIFARIVKLTAAKFGRPVNPHLFRDCAATSIAVNDPDHVLITKDILGHSTMRTSERHYNHVQSHGAITVYQEHVLAMRRQGRRRSNRIGRHKLG